MFANALSGINVATKSIGAISHNISNAASAGFKASTARFADVMSSSSRDTVAKGAVGNGAMMAGAQVNFTQGNLKTTGQALDLAITGQGMFVKFAGAEAVDFAAPGAGDVFFTRNGSFSLDRNNHLVDSAGRFVASVTGQKVQIPSGLETEFETDLYAPAPATAPAGPLKVYRDAVAGAASPADQEAALIAAGLAPADFKRDSALLVTGSTRETRGRLVLTDAAAERLGLEDGASRLLDPDRFTQFDLVSGGTVNDLFEAEKARIHDALGLGGLKNALALWEPAYDAYQQEVSYLSDLPADNEFKREFGVIETNLLKKLHEDVLKSNKVNEFSLEIYSFASKLKLVTPEDQGVWDKLKDPQKAEENQSSLVALSKRVDGPGLVDLMVKKLEGRVSPQPVDPDGTARPLMMKSPNYQRALELISKWREIVPQGATPAGNFATNDFVSRFGDEVSKITRVFEVQKHNQDMIDSVFSTDNRAAFYASSLINGYEDAGTTDPLTTNPDARPTFILLRGREIADLALNKGLNLQGWQDKLKLALNDVAGRPDGTVVENARRDAARRLADAMPVDASGQLSFIKSNADEIFRIVQRMENYSDATRFTGLWDALAEEIGPLGIANASEATIDLYQEVSRRLEGVEPAKAGYERIKVDFEIAQLRFADQVSELGGGSTLVPGWNLDGHRLTLRAEGALGAKLALLPAEAADTTEGAISFADGRIWKGLGDVQGYGAVAAEIGRVTKAAQTLAGSMMDIALGFVAPRPLPADPPVVPAPIDPAITREDVNKIFGLAQVSMSRLAAEPRKGSAEGEAPLGLILRADLVQPSGGTLARIDTRAAFDETLEAPPSRDLLSALEVTTDGRIFATYGGGSGTAQPAPVAQLAVAFFANPALLTQVGGGDFRRSATSGPPDVRGLGEAAGTQIRSGVLEMANVDLTEELVQMLKFQQMFQSASKAMQSDVDSVAKVIEVR